MFVSVLVNNTHMICNVGTTRSQEPVSLQRQVELLLVQVSQLDRERGAAEEMAKHERRRADAEKIRADGAETRADGAEAQVKEVETEKMGIEWTNLSFRCYHHEQVSDMRSFDV